MNAQNKLNASKENDVEMFIDDSVAHCRNVQSGGIITFYILLPVIKLWRQMICREYIHGHKFMINIKK